MVTGPHLPESLPLVDLKDSQEYLVELSELLKEVRVALEYLILLHLFLIYHLLASFKS